MERLTRAVAEKKFKNLLLTIRSFVLLAFFFHANRTKVMLPVVV